MNDNISSLISSPLLKLVWGAKLMNLHKTKSFLSFMMKNNALSLSKKFSSEVIESLLKAIAIFEDHYKERFDFYLERNSYGQFVPVMRVLYPKFTITNSSGFSHEIKDLVVLYYLSTGPTDQLNLRSLSGARFSKTHLEILSNYQQSHLSAVRDWEENPFQIGNFCLGGTTDMSYLVGEMSMQLDLDRLELLLFSVDSMITWESLEGVPYKYISSIKNADSAVISSFSQRTSERILENIISNKRVLEVDFYIEENRYRIKPNKRASDFIKKIVLEEFTNVSDLRNILVTPCPVYPNTYLGMKSGSSGVGTISIRDKKAYTIFNGSKIYPKVIKNNIKDIVKVPIEDYIIYPNLLKNVCRELEYKIYKKAIALSAAKL